MAQNFHFNRCQANNPGRIDPNQSENLLLGNVTGNEGRPATAPIERRYPVDRRDGVWWSFLYGNFRPRRRCSRRVTDEHHFLFDWHEPRILYVALGIVLLSCADALFTLNLLEAGATEANAIMASMLDHGVDRFLLVKISITALSVVFLVIAARRKFVGPFSVAHLLQIFCAGYFVLICYELYLFWYVFEISVLPSS